MNIILSIALISGLIWLYLIFFRGQFWQTDQQLDLSSPSLTDFPSVCAIIPARNEADVLPISLPSLLQQNYPNLQVILIDDQSTDNTGKIAQDLAANLGQSSKLHLIAGQSLPPGWSGKLWALNQGVEFAHNLPQKPDYFLLTDADILHNHDNINHLINHSIKNNLDMVSLMVLLRCTSIWERFLIPAFVFFFAKLYPFQWVNNHQNKTAAAAGGCILIKREILTKIGGIEILRQALIDDCTLAKYVKDSGGKIWLGLTKL
ncbi:MAG TPA: glycosyltransferase, partial [Allocoleopsis sp.]